MPDNAKACYDDLVSVPRVLSHVRYGVIALGDRTYVETFCNGGRRFDEALAALGAKRIGEILQHDASGGTMPEDVALEWFPQWLRQVRAALDTGGSRRCGRAARYAARRRLTRPRMRRHNRQSRFQPTRS